jgi:hypothetical protein
MFPGLYRLWVARTDDEAQQLNERGIEAVVVPEGSHGLEAAEAVLMAFGIAPDAVRKWCAQQRARLASPLAA